MFAGHETTATSLAWAFDLLLHLPEALGRLVAELDQGAMEYLDATITETLRVRPVVALVDRHTPNRSGLAGIRFWQERRRAPTSTSLSGVRTCTRTPLRSVRTGSASRPQAGGWFPFGGGIQRCLGASFATFEMRIVLPEVLRAVTLRPASPRPARIRREVVTFVPHDGVRCVVTART